MKTLRCIAVVFLSLLITYAGAGVSLIHYCCMDCQTLGVEALDVNACHKVHEIASIHDRCSSCVADLNANHAHQEKCCNAEICKLDLLKLSLNTQVVAPVLDLFISQFTLLSEPEQTIFSTLATCYHSPPESSRFLLNLYCTLLI